MGPHLGSLRGLSLAEAVVALFLMSAGVMVAAAAFQRCLVYQRHSLRQREAAVLAENLLTRLKVYRDRFGASSQSWPDYWALYANDSFQLENQMQVSLRAQQRAVYSPCLGLETHFLAQARKLSQSAVDVQIQLRWAAGPGGSLQCRTLLAAPAPEVTSLRLQRLDFGTVARDGFARLEVEALDSSGRPLPDLCFAWRIDTDASTHQPGMATLELPDNRRGDRVRVFHRLYRPDESVTYAGGLTRVSAWCRGPSGPVSASQTLELAP